ncbi:MAG TPA: BatA and WFA domain-containing protein [Acidimicrobiia bacterium]
MSFLVPVALGVAALAGPLLILYMLRSRRRQLDVTSTRLWQASEIQVTSAVPWSRLRWTALLILQLLAIALFAFALARPFHSQRTLLGPHSVFVIDTSGSMAEGDRLDRAKTEAVALAEDLSEGNLISVIGAGPHPQVLIGHARERDDVIATIESLRAGGGEADLSEAIRLGRGLATPDRPTNVIVFSDGGEAPLPEEPVAGATHIPFHEIVDDVAVETLTIDATGGVTRGLVAVANHSEADTSVELAVTVEGMPSTQMELDLGANQRAVETFELDAAPGSEVMVERLGEADGNPLDDRVWTVIDQNAARSVRVMGEGSPYLAALVSATPGFELGSDDGDVLVVDRGVLPPIDRPAWLIRPDSTPEGLEITGLVENIPATFQAPGEPVLDNVDLSDLVVAEAQNVAPRGWSPIVRSGDVPLILLGSVDGHRVVYFTFDLTHTNLPVQVSFPILGAALLNWLVGEAPGTVANGPAGEPIVISSPDGAQPVVTLPDGSQRTLPGDTASFTDTSEPGIYRVGYVDEDGTVTAGQIAVRTFVATEAGAPVRDIVTSTGDSSAEEQGVVVREWGPWVVSALLALLAFEWWIGHQRPWLRQTA